jgi:hypothetical protein
MTNAITLEPYTGTWPNDDPMPVFEQWSLNIRASMGLRLLKF